MGLGLTGSLDHAWVGACLVAWFVAWLVAWLVAWVGAWVPWCIGGSMGGGDVLMCWGGFNGPACPSTTTPF